MIMGQIAYLDAYGVAPGGHGHPVLGFADVDASGMRVTDLEGVGEHG
jgi:hypothetical protein